MRVKFGFLLYLASMTALSLPGHAAVSLRLAPTAPVVAPGQVFDIALAISGLTPDSALGAFDIDVGFDPVILGFQGADFGDPVLFDQLDLSGSHANNPLAIAGFGNVSLIEVSFDTVDDLLARQADAFILVTLHFVAQSTGLAPLALSVNSLVDEMGREIEVPELPVDTLSVTPVPLPPPLFLLLGAGAVLIRLRHSRVASC